MREATRRVATPASSRPSQEHTVTIDQLRDAINTLTVQIDRLDARIANLTDLLHSEEAP